VPSSPAIAPSTVSGNPVQSPGLKSRLGIIGSLLFLVVAGLVLSHRHFYDDELRNIWLIHQYGYLDLIKFVNIKDVHPPLSYLVNKLFFNLFSSYELIIVPTIIFLGLTLYLFYAYAEPYLEDNYAKALLFLFTFLNPNILMWGVSLRWYSYWIGLFLLVFIIVFLAPRRSSSLYLTTIIAVLMTYISYLTFIVFPLFFIVWLIKYRFDNLKEILLSWLLYVVLASYQIYIFLRFSLNHTQNQIEPPLKSILMVLYSLSLGNTVFPLDPIGMIYGLALLIISLYLLLKIKQLSKDQQRFILFIPFFILANTILLSISGLGSKLRNSLYLNIIFMFAVSFLLILLRRKAKITFLALASVFIAVSSYHFVLHKNTAKIAVNLPVEQLQSWLASLKTAPGRPDHE
jgi:hypothetical protein